MWGNVALKNNGYSAKKFKVPILLTACSFYCWIPTKEVMVWLSCACLVHDRRQLHNRRCAWQKVGQGAQMSESLGVLKVGGSSLAALQKFTPTVTAT